MKFIHNMTRCINRNKDIEFVECFSLLTSSHDYRLYPPYRHSSRGLRTQLQNSTLSFCALSYRASTYSMTQNLNVSPYCSRFLTTTHDSLRLLRAYLLSSFYTIHGGQPFMTHDTFALHDLKM